MDFTAGLMPLDTALTQMLNRITPLNATETVPLLQAFSRVTAHDLVSPLNVPGFDNSAMDGYAVRLADLTDVAAFRHRSAGHNADTGARRPVTVKRLTGEGLAGDRQRCAVGEIRQAYRIAVHCRVIKTGHVER